MNEQILIKKQLIKNMIVTFIVITILFIFLDLIIYNQVWSSLYKTIDSELIMIAERGIKQEDTKPISNIPIYKKDEKKINPRFIYILRNKEGYITNSSAIGRVYDEYLLDINFDKNVTNKIYSFKVNNQYNYRGITIKMQNEQSEEMYIQILVNVDGEAITVKNLTNTLIIGTLIIIIVSILASYILSRRTLKPILSSWRKQTEFVQNVAHELRTPLTIMQAKEQLLLDEPKSKIIDKSEDINIILKEMRRLTKLVKELMILAMADSNQLIMNKQPTNIDELIKEITLPYIDFANMQNKKIILALKFNKKINIDKDKIEQLIIILLDNAIKYTKEGEEIQISTFAKEEKCIIEVSDTGQGIKKENLNHIFDRFFREDKARTRESGGNGLGLSLAHTIVILHGGTIKAVQNEPKGTRIIIKI